MVKKVGKYEIGKTLGEGTFGKVKYAVNTDTNEKVAIKVLEKSIIQRQNMGAQVKREISIMKKVRHKYIVQLKEVLASNTKIFLVCELITGGELFEKIVEKQRLTEDEARFYFTQLVEGVEYCHSQGVCHRDLKPENILLDGDGNIKISDFGLSNLYSGGDDEALKLLHTTCGTPNYVAPEVLADKGYDGRKADVWSLGVILYVFIAGFLPFDEPSMSNLFRKIQAADFSYPRWFSEEVRSLIDAILISDPAHRISLAQIKKHQWFLKGSHLLEKRENLVEKEPLVDESLAHSPAIIVPTADDLNSAVQDTVTERKEEGEEVETASNRESLDEMRGSARLSNFQSTVPIQDLLKAVSDTLASMGCELRVFDSSNKIKACFMSPKGMVAVVVQLRAAAPLDNSEGSVLHVVEVRKAKGDSFEFSKFHKDLMENRLQHLVHMARLDDIGSNVAEEGA